MSSFCWSAYGVMNYFAGPYSRQRAPTTAALFLSLRATALRRPAAGRRRRQCTPAPMPALPLVVPRA